MGVLNPLIELLIRSVVVLMPLTVGWLAFRRLALSKSGNAWIYAVTCLLAAVTVAGVLPWALSLTAASWIFVALSLFCPLIWVGVVLLCDTSRRHEYGPDPLVDTLRGKKTPRKPETLVLEHPVEDARPVFRHSKPQPNIPMATSKPAPTTRTLMTIAREIRDGRTSDRRRPKLLPPPEKREMPFIRTRG